MSPDLSKSFAIKKIFYPSGGYRELVFEPHEVYVNNIKKDVGGIRISKIINYDGISSSEVEYAYHNSGQLYSEDPDYGHIYHNIIDNYVLVFCRDKAFSDLYFDGVDIDYHSIPFL